ncbi:unnamed protein product [Amoebophrya sp. A25]|nr:unnamed protein product [Amoebophrya sp. A25]|eukprot:GSA25T00011484001.1
MKPTMSSQFQRCSVATLRYISLVYLAGRSSLCSALSLNNPPHDEIRLRGARRGFAGDGEDAFERSLLDEGERDEAVDREDEDEDHTLTRSSREEQGVGNKVSKGRSENPIDENDADIKEQNDSDTQAVSSSKDSTFADEDEEDSDQSQDEIQEQYQPSSALDKDTKSSELPRSGAAHSSSAVSYAKATRVTALHELHRENVNEHEITAQQHQEKHSNAEEKTAGQQDRRRISRGHQHHQKGVQARRLNRARKRRDRESSPSGKPQRSSKRSSKLHQGPQLMQSRRRAVREVLSERRKLPGFEVPPEMLDSVSMCSGNSEETPLKFQVNGCYVSVEDVTTRDSARCAGFSEAQGQFWNCSGIGVPESEALMTAKGKYSGRRLMYEIPEFEAFQSLEIDLVVKTRGTIIDIEGDTDYAPNANGDGEYEYDGSRLAVVLQTVSNKVMHLILDGPNTLFSIDDTDISAVTQTCPDLVADCGIEAAAGRVAYTPGEQFTLRLETDDSNAIKLAVTINGNTTLFGDPLGKDIPSQTGDGAAIGNQIAKVGIYTGRNQIAIPLLFPQEEPCIPWPGPDASGGSSSSSTSAPPNSTNDTDATTTAARLNICPRPAPVDVARHLVAFTEYPFTDCAAEDLGVDSPRGVFGYDLLHRCADICQQHLECGGFLIKNTYALASLHAASGTQLADQTCMLKKTFLTGRPLWASCVPADDAVTYVRQTTLSFIGQNNEFLTRPTQTLDHEALLPLGTQFSPVYDNIITLGREKQEKERAAQKMRYNAAQNRNASALLLALSSSSNTTMGRGDGNVRVSSGTALLQKSEIGAFSRTRYTQGAVGGDVGKVTVTFLEHSYTVCGVSKLKVTPDRKEDVDKLKELNGYELLHRCADLCQQMRNCGGFQIKNTVGINIEGNEVLEKQRCELKSTMFQGRPLWSFCVPDDYITTYEKQSVFRFLGSDAMALSTDSLEPEVLPLASQLEPVFEDDSGADAEL